MRVLVADRLAAVVSSVDPLNFGAEPLRRNLEDLSWLASTARAHHAVVDAVVAPRAGRPTAPGHGLRRRRQRARRCSTAARPLSLALLDRVRGRPEGGGCRGVRRAGLRGRTRRGRRRQGGTDPGRRTCGSRHWRRRDRTSRLRRGGARAVEDLHRVLAASAEDSHHRLHAAGHTKIRTTPPISRSMRPTTSSSGSSSPGSAQRRRP